MGLISRFKIKQTQNLCIGAYINAKSRSVGHILKRLSILISKFFEMSEDSTNTKLQKVANVLNLFRLRIFTKKISFTSKKLKIKEI